MLEIGGLTAGTQFDQLIVNGAASLGGTLDIVTVNGFNTALGNSFPVVVFSSVNGTFETTNGLNLGSGKVFRLDYNPKNLTLTVIAG